MRKKPLALLLAAVTLAALPAFGGCSLVPRVTQPAPTVVTVQAPPPAPTTTVAAVETQPATTGKAGSGSATSNVPAASPPTAVIDETVIDAPHGSITTTPQGTVTITLRSVEVRGEVLTLHWALRWDDDGSLDDAAQSQYDFGIYATDGTITDPVGLVLYRPFCTKGAWKGSAVDTLTCRLSALTSLSDSIADYFVNHHRIEISGLFPAPQGHPETVDVQVASGVPAFTNVPVTYR